MQFESEKIKNKEPDSEKQTIFEEIKSSLAEAIAIEESRNKKRSFDNSIEHHSAFFDFLKKGKRED